MKSYPADIPFYYCSYGQMYGTKRKLFGIRVNVREPLKPTAIELEQCAQDERQNMAC